MNFNLSNIYIFIKKNIHLYPKIGIKGRILLTAFKIIQIYIEIQITI